MKLDGNSMNQHLDARFPLAGALRLRAMHVLSGCSPEQWQADMFALRVDVDALKASLHAQELKNSAMNSHIGWLMMEAEPNSFLTTYAMKVTHGTSLPKMRRRFYITGLTPAGCLMDTLISSFLILKSWRKSCCDGERIRRKAIQQTHSVSALIALEKVFRIDVLFSEGSKAGGLEEACLSSFHACHRRNGNGLCS